jgi:cyclopropane fatty-acyl-phospholipid synthase-like methyltransferase
MNVKNTTFSIHGNGCWDGDTTAKHYHDQTLSQSIIDVLLDYNVKTVLDLGCGRGDYAKKIIEHNIRCDCYDGHPDTKIITQGICDTIDLSKPISLAKTYDCVISLEVGEHIPQSCEHNFITNILKHSHDLVILSWAIPGQPGDGHVNCKTNDYIINLIEQQKFYFDSQITQLFRRQSSLWWFKNTLMFFQKIKQY